MVASFFSLGTLFKPDPTDVLAFTIWYRSIRSMYDLQLDIQKVSCFLGSRLVHQMYSKRVYFCSFVTKSNQARTKYLPKLIQKFL